MQNRLGLHGENLAVSYLMGRGFLIRKRNIIIDGIEVDILATGKNTGKLIEVKYRRHSEFLSQDGLVSLQQEKRLKEAARIFSEILEMEVAVDLISITRFRKSLSLKHFHNLL
jgi:putative endonuclease